MLDPLANLSSFATKSSSAGDAAGKYQTSSGTTGAPTERAWIMVGE